MCIFNGMDRNMCTIYSMPCLELLTCSLKGIQMARDGGASTGREAPAPVAAGASLPPVTAAWSQAAAAAATAATAATAAALQLPRDAPRPDKVSDSVPIAGLSTTSLQNFLFPFHLCQCVGDSKENIATSQKAVLALCTIWGTCDLLVGYQQSPCSPNWFSLELAVL